MRRVLLAIVTTVTGLVMLLSFKTHAIVNTRAGAAVNPPAAVTPAAGASPEPTGASPSTGATAKRANPAATRKTVTGSSVDTRYGPVQVKITVTNGKVTSAVAVDYPTGNGRDQEINSSAIPTLEQETLSANSASIDMVSGATYTSEGYITSLQSALDQA